MSTDPVRERRPVMRRQRHVTATPTSSSSMERRHDDTARTTTTTTTDVEPHGGRLRRVRSFTMRSGTVVNRGDSFKVRGGGDDDDPSRRRRHVDDAPAQRPRSATPTRRRTHDPSTSSAVVSRVGPARSTADTSYTVLVLGSGGVGKTTVVRQLLTSEHLAGRDENVGN